MANTDAAYFSLKHEVPNMLYTIISSTPMYVCGTLIILLALSLCTKWDTARYRLLLFMLTSLILYIGNFAYFNHMESVIPITDTLYCYSLPACFPVFLMYIEALVLKDPGHKRGFLYILPAIICGLSAGFIYATKSGEELTWWVTAIHKCVRIIFTLQVPLVLYFGWKHISDYNKMVENYYADTDDKEVTLIKPLLISFVAASLISFTINLIGHDYFAESVWLLAIPSLSFSALLLFTGFVGLTQNTKTREVVEESDMPEETEQDIIPLTPEKEHIMAAEIRKLMDEKQLFLQPNLKINDLAKMLNTNRNYIYNAINQGIGLSFAEYINKKRIEYAVQLIEQDREILLTDVAHKSGFSSPSAFYRNFKLYMDCTPSDYQKRGASIAASTLSK